MVEIIFLIIFLLIFPSLYLLLKYFEFHLNQEWQSVTECKKCGHVNTDLMAPPDEWQLNQKYCDGDVDVFTARMEYKQGTKWWYWNKEGKWVKQ